jgi:hypothetical protein
MIEVVSFTKANGPLTKRIFLNADGTLSSDGSLCLMAKGIAQRTFANSAKELAALIESVSWPPPSGPCSVCTPHKRLGAT